MNMIYKICHKNNNREITAKIDKKYGEIANKFKLNEIYIPLIIIENKRSIKMIKCKFNISDNNCLMLFSLPFNLENIAYIESIIKLAQNIFDNINKN